MATWKDVDDLVLGLPDARASTAHEGSPSWSAGSHQFARLRWDDDGRELLQTWSGDLSLGDALRGRVDVFPWCTRSATASPRGRSWSGSAAEK